MTANFDKSEYKINWIPVKLLCVRWAQAQRRFDEAHAKRLAAEFDPDIFGEMVATQPNDDGLHHVIDGQHRAWMIQTLFGPEERVPCRIINCTDPARAAQIFDKLNTSRKLPHAVDIFRVRVAAGEQIEVAVNKIITGLGYRVEMSSQDGAIRAVQACIAVYRRFGAGGLRDTLLILQGAWGKDVNATDANLIRGVAEFLNEHGNRVDRKKLVEKTAKQYTPGRLLGAAKGAREMFRGTMAENVSRALLSTYNYGLRAGRLGEAEAA